MLGRMWKRSCVARASPLLSKANGEADKVNPTLRTLEGLWVKNTRPCRELDRCLKHGVGSERVDEVEARARIRVVGRALVHI